MGWSGGQRTELALTTGTDWHHDYTTGQYISLRSWVNVVVLGNFHWEIMVIFGSTCISSFLDGCAEDRFPEIQIEKALT